MHPRYGPVIALLMVSVAARAQSAAASTGYKPCSLLTKSEAEALSGQKVTKSGEMNTPYKKDANHGHDGVMSICSYIVAPARIVRITVGSVPVTAAEKKKGEAAVKESMQSLKEQGAAVEEKKFGDMSCSTLKLKGELAPLNGTSCGAVKGQTFFSLSVSAGPNGLVPMEQVNALAKKVLSRLP